MMQPWLSILIPAHNPGGYLAEALDSVLAQVDAQAEVLVFDDASTDGTAALLAQQLAAMKPGMAAVRVLATQDLPTVAVGVSRARNALLDAARGQWLWFLDADDRLRPDAVARVRAVVQAADDLQAVVVDHAVLRPRSGLKHRLRGEHHRRSLDRPVGGLVPPEALMPALMACGQWHVWGKVVRRDAWPPNLRFPAQRVFEDLSVVPRLMAGMNRVWYLNAPLVDYRSNPASILGSMNQAKLRDWALALQDLEETPGFDHAWAEFVAQQALRLLRVARRMNDAGAWLDAWWAGLCARQPQLQTTLAGWRFQPRRWAAWWQAHQQGWCQGMKR